MSAFNWLDDCCVWVRFYAYGVVLPLFKYMQKTAIFAFENVATEINICCGGCCGTHMRHIKNVRLPFQLVRCCNSHPCFFSLHEFCHINSHYSLIISRQHQNNINKLLYNFIYSYSYTNNTCVFEMQFPWFVVAVQQRQRRVTCCPSDQPTTKKEHTDRKFMGKFFWMTEQNCWFALHNKFNFHWILIQIPSE